MPQSSQTLKVNAKLYLNDTYVRNWDGMNVIPRIGEHMTDATFPSPTGAIYTVQDVRWGDKDNLEIFLVT